MADDWRQTVLAATHGTQLGAILWTALDMPVPEENEPCFVGKATITSDGFIMCDFRDRNGVYRPGAFVGSVSDLEDNIVGLAAYLNLPADYRAELGMAIHGWIGHDYRVDHVFNFNWKQLP